MTIFLECGLFVWLLASSLQLAARFYILYFVSADIFQVPLELLEMQKDKKADMYVGKSQQDQEGR